MPGLSIVCGTSLDPNSVESLQYEGRIRIRNIIDADGFHLVFSAFKGYPMLHINSETSDIFIEGIIYNKSTASLKEQLTKLARTYVNGQDYQSLLNEFTLHNSGDYLILMYSRELNEFLFFNDRWGRLPCFYLTGTESVVISREVKFLLHYLPRICYSKMAIAEYLVLRYCLGNRTIFENVSRLLPGQVIHGSEDGFSCFDVNAPIFEHSGQKEKTRDYYIKKATRILLSSTRNSLEHLGDFGSISVDISGGYDTRAVFAAACKLDASIIPTTMNLWTGDESSVARKVTDVCGMELLYVSPDRSSTFENTQEVLYKTDGFVDGRTALASYEEAAYLRNKLAEPVAEFHGFGGEFLRHPLKKESFHKSILDVLINNPLTVTLIESSCACLGINVQDAYSHWEEFFKLNYKEANLDDQVMHYYFDYYNALVGMGEDRSRIHVWPVSPMMSSELLSFATTEVPRKMIGYSFFEDLISAVNPQLAVTKIPIWDNAFWRSRAFKFIDGNRRLRNIGKSFYKWRWRRAAKRDNKRGAMIQKTLELYDTTGSIRGCFDREGVVNFIENECGPNNRFIWQLLSLFLFMNSVEAIHTKRVSTELT